MSSAEGPAQTGPANRFTFSVGGTEQGAGGHWYRGEHCNFNPKVKNLRSGQDIIDYVLKGWLPEQPLIGPETRVTAFGSCFAQHIRNWLKWRRFNVLNADAKSRAHLVKMGEGMVNTFSLAEQIRWGFEGERPDGDYWFGPGAEAFEVSEDARRDTENILRQTDVFIITLGLSEIWYDKATGGVFWRGVPLDRFDPDRHAFRVASFEENKRNIRLIHDLIRKHRPEAKVIFTVPPVPLVATFRPVACMTASSASKALLRGAVDEVYREVEDEGAMFYWPSYEIIMDVFDNRWAPDRRHVRQPLVDFIMTLFEHVWCYGSQTQLSIAEAYEQARLAPTP